MIPIQTLKYLISNKIKDAKTLMENKRLATSIYIAGYAVEIALKYKICRTLHFNQGFPETKQEINNYLTYINRNNAQPLSIRLVDIRNHDLNQLLFYSGVELLIKSSFFPEWAIVNQWNPELRYKKSRVLQKTAESYYESATKIIREIN